VNLKNYTYLAPSYGRAYCRQFHSLDSIGASLASRVDVQGLTGESVMYCRAEFVRAVARRWLNAAAIGPCYVLWGNA